GLPLAPGSGGIDGSRNHPSAEHEDNTSFADDGEAGGCRVAVDQECSIMVPSRPVEVRRAELVAALSLGTDLGLGQPMEHVIRQTLIALRMSELLGLDEAERKVVYYSGLLEIGRAHVCT